MSSIMSLINITNYYMRGMSIAPGVMNNYLVKNSKISN